jgi:hypothetical protein
VTNWWFKDATGLLRARWLVFQRINLQEGEEFSFFQRRHRALVIIVRSQQFGPPGHQRCKHSGDASVSVLIANSDRGSVLPVERADIGTVLQQLPKHSHVAARGGPVQEAKPIRINRIDVAASLHQLRFPQHAAQPK